MQKFDYSPTQLIDVVNKKDSKGRTPLFIAVENEYDDVVEFLLDNSADVTLLYADTILALSYSCTYLLNLVKHKNLH